jgi:hypothetical protein
MLAHGRGVQTFPAGGSPGEIGAVLDIWKRPPRSYLRTSTCPAGRKMKSAMVPLVLAS